MKELQLPSGHRLKTTPLPLPPTSLQSQKVHDLWEIFNEEKSLLLILLIHPVTPSLTCSPPWCAACWPWRDGGSWRTQVQVCFVRTWCSNDGSPLLWLAQHVLLTVTRGGRVRMSWSLFTCLELRLSSLTCAVSLPALLFTSITNLCLVKKKLSRLNLSCLN